MNQHSGSARLSITIVVVGLIALMFALPWWLHSSAPTFGLFYSLLSGAAVPALLVFAVRARMRNWSGITALCMIPFAVIGVMDIVANLDNPAQGMIIAVISIAVFIAALDAGRRAPQG